MPAVPASAVDEGRSKRPLPTPAARTASGAESLAGGGDWVRVTRGPAVGARGWITRRTDGRVTMVATLLAHRALVLTVDAADCQPLRVDDDLR